MPLYGWTVETIVKRIQGNVRGLGTSSSRIDESIITDAMNEAEGQLNGILESRCINPDAIVDSGSTRNAYQILRAAMLAYVRAEVYSLMPGFDSKVNTERQSWREQLKLLRTESDRLGKTDNTAYPHMPSTVQSTVNGNTNNYQGRWPGDINDEW